MMYSFGKVSDSICTQQHRTLCQLECEIKLEVFNKTTGISFVAHTVQSQTGPLGCPVSGISDALTSGSKMYLNYYSVQAGSPYADEGKRARYGNDT